MSPLSARDALVYAISPAVLRLLAVVLVGVVLLPAGLGLAGPVGLQAPGLAGVMLGVVRLVVGLALALVGFLALYGGLVALLYKVLVDARGATTA